MAKLVVDITPHHGAMTKAGSANFARFCDAASEFVDNSLQAYLDTALLSSSRPDEKLVELSLFLNQTKMAHSMARVGDGKAMDSNSYMVIADKGCGMDEEKLKNFATYSLDKETRNEDDEFISKFGVGAKQSGFYLGENLHVLTSSKTDSDKVLEMKLDANVFEERYQQGGKVFEATINKREVSRQNGNISLGNGDGMEDGSLFGNPSLSKSMINYIRAFEAEHADHFTIIVVKLKEKIVRSLLDNDRYSELPYDFGHIYHFYLHPEHLPYNIVQDDRFKHKPLSGTSSGAHASNYILQKVTEEPYIRGVNRKEDIEETLKVPFHFKLKIFKGEGVLYDESIGTVNDDVSQYINSAKAVFRMNMDFVDPEQQSKSKVQSQIDRPAEKATVQCIFFYYPYNHGETRPVISNYNNYNGSADAFLTSRGDDDDGNDHNVNDKAGKSKDKKRKAGSTSNVGYEPLQFTSSSSSKGAEKEKSSQSKSRSKSKTLSRMSKGGFDDLDDSDMDIAGDETTSLGKMSPAGSLSSNISPAGSNASSGCGDDGGLDLTDSLQDLLSTKKEEDEEKFHEGPAPECEIFWVNRCVPESSVKSFPFWPKGVNSRAECEKQDIAFHWRRRIKGYMFFDHKWNHISNNKLKVQVDPNLDHYLNERLTAHDIAYKPNATPELFKKWLQECHNRFDQENRYSLRLDKVETVAKNLVSNPPPHSSLRGRPGFNSALFRRLETGVGNQANEYTVGDKVMLFVGQQPDPGSTASKKESRVTKKKYILAEIVGFDVDDTLVSADQSSFCGKGHIRYLRLPLEVFHPQYVEEHSNKVIKPLQDSSGFLKDASQDLWEQRDRGHDVRVMECLLENERVPLAALDDTKKVDNRTHAQKNVIKEIEGIKERAPKRLELYLFSECGGKPSLFNNRKVDVTVGTKYFKIGALILNGKSELCVFRPECMKAQAGRMMYAVHLTLKDENGDEVLYDYKATNDWYEASSGEDNSSEMSISKDIRVDTNELWKRTSTTEKSKQKTSSSDKMNQCMLSFYGAKAGGRSSTAVGHNRPNLSFEQAGNFVLHAEVLAPNSKFPIVSLDTKISVVSQPVSNFKLQLDSAQKSTLQMGGFLPPFTIILVDNNDQVVKDFEGRLKLKIVCSLDMDIVATLNPEQAEEMFAKYQDPHRVYELLKEADQLAPGCPLYPIEGIEDEGELSLNQFSFLCVPRPGYKSTLEDMDDTLPAEFTIEVLLYDDNHDNSGIGHLLSGASTPGTQPIDNGDNYTIVLGTQVIKATFGTGTPFDLVRTDVDGDIVSPPLIVQGGDGVSELELCCVDRWGGRCGPPKGSERWEVTLPDCDYISARNVTAWTLNNRGEVTVNNLHTRMPEQSKFDNGELKSELSFQMTVSKVSGKCKSKSKKSDRVVRAWKVSGIPVIIEPKEYPVRLELRYHETVLVGNIKPDNDGDSLESMDIAEGEDDTHARSFSAGDVLSNISYHLFDKHDKEVMLGDAPEWIKKKDNGFYCISDMAPESTAKRPWSSRPKVYKPPLSSQSQGLPDITLPKFVGKFEFSVTLEFNNNVTLKSEPFHIETKPGGASKWECIVGGNKSSDDSESTDVCLLSGEKDDAYDKLTAIVLRDRDGQYVSWDKDTHSKPDLKLFRDQKAANSYKGLHMVGTGEKGAGAGDNDKERDGDISIGVRAEEDSETEEESEKSKKRRSSSGSKKSHQADTVMVTLSAPPTSALADKEDGGDEVVDIPVTLGCVVVHRNERGQETLYERISRTDYHNSQTSQETRDHFSKRGIWCWLIDVKEVDIFARKEVPEDVWIFVGSHGNPYNGVESQEQVSMALSSKRTYDVAHRQKEVQPSTINYDFKRVSIQAGYMRRLCLKEVTDDDDDDDSEYRNCISMNIDRFTQKKVRVHICDAHNHLANLAYPALKKGKSMTLRVFKMANDEYSEETASYINTSTSMVTDTQEASEEKADYSSLKACKTSRNAEDGDIDVYKMKKVADNVFEVELDFNTPAWTTALTTMTTKAAQSNIGKNSNQWLQFRLAMQLSFQLTDNERQMLPLSYIHCKMLRMNMVTSLRVSHVPMLASNGTQMDLETGQEVDAVESEIESEGVVNMLYDESVPVLRVRAVTDEDTVYTPSCEQQWIVVKVNWCDTPEVKGKDKKRGGHNSSSISNPAQSLSPITSVYQQRATPGAEYAEFVSCTNNTARIDSSSVFQRLPVGVYSVQINYLETRPSLLHHVDNDNGVSLQFKLRVQPCVANKIVLSEESESMFVGAAATNFVSADGMSNDRNVIVPSSIKVECRDMYNNLTTFNNVQGWESDDIYYTVRLIELRNNDVENEADSSMHNHDLSAGAANLPSLVGQDKQGYLHGKLDKGSHSYSIKSLELVDGVGGGVSRKIGLLFEAFVKDNDGGSVTNVLTSSETSFRFTANAQRATALKALQEKMRALKERFEPYYEQEQHLEEELSESESLLNLLITATKSKPTFKPIVNNLSDHGKREVLKLSLHKELERMNTKIVRKTISPRQVDSAITGQYDDIKGTLVDLGYCNDWNTAQILSKACGNRIGAIISQSVATSTSLYNHHKVASWALDTIPVFKQHVRGEQNSRKRSAEDMLSGRLRLPAICKREEEAAKGHPEYLVNLIQLPSDNESLRDTVFWNMFHTTVLFDNLAALHAYRKECIDKEKKPGPAYTREGDFVPSDGFMDPRNKIDLERGPSKNAFVFGEMPWKYDVDYRRLKDDVKLLSDLDKNFDKHYEAKAALGAHHDNKGAMEQCLEEYEHLKAELDNM